MKGREVSRVVPRAGMMNRIGHLWEWWTLSRCEKCGMPGKKKEMRPIYNYRGGEFPVKYLFGRAHMFCLLQCSEQHCLAAAISSCRTCAIPLCQGHVRAGIDGKGYQGGWGYCGPCVDNQLRGMEKR